VKESILIVDDLPDNVRLFRIVLELAGYRIAVAGTGVEALAAVKSSRPDMILMDLQLLGPMTGRQTLAAVRALPGGRDIVVLAFTASTVIERDEIRAEGFDGLMLKPVNVATMAREISGYFRTHGDANA
jgi:CheY-like chemotaxis protein